MIFVETNSPNFEPKSCHDFAKSQHKYLRTIIINFESITTSHSIENVKWLKPNVDIFKCNIDASFSTQLNKAGFDTFIRDDTSTFVLAKT